MHFTTLSLTSFAALAGLAAASWNHADHGEHHGGHQGGQPYSTLCWTEYGTQQQAQHNTQWQTTYTPCSWSPPSTKTVTIHTGGKTATVTQTSTVTSTSTSIVPTSSGFLPVQSTLPGSTYDGNGGADPVAKRDTLLARQGNTGGGYFPGSKQKMYPHGVTCKQWRPSQCPLHTVITTVTRGPSKTITVTSTTTVYPSTTTVYAVCASNNLADVYQGTIIGNTLPSNVPAQPQILLGQVGSAYDCCVSAAQGPPGSAFGYNNVLSETIDDNNCFYYAPIVCPAAGAQAANLVTAYVGDGGFGQLTVGNLNCGEINVVATE